MTRAPTASYHLLDGHAQGLHEGARVARVVLLLDAEHGDVAIGPETAHRLARLGVTNVTLVRDRHTVAVVVDGWAFDPAGAVHALAILTGGTSHGRVLQPVADMAVSSAPNERKST